MCSATADSPTTSSGSPKRSEITASTSPASSGPDTTDEELQTITGEDLRAAVVRELDRADKEQHIELSRGATGGVQ